MAAGRGRGIFDRGFLLALRSLIAVHHSIYPEIPPQGIYFESLVEKALRDINKPFTVIPGARNQPTHDLLVGGVRLSIKTETGKGTRPNFITITKLSTMEREPWDRESLVSRMVTHLSGYDVILLLRAIWTLPLLHYQLVEVPVSLLKLMATAEFEKAGRRAGRQSLGADVCKKDAVAFHVHFDASDGKCSIRNLRLELCATLLEWDHQMNT
jgi:restriction endonuclease SmaI-like protein